MVLLTVATVLVQFIPSARWRGTVEGLMLAVGWWLYVSRSRSRLQLAGHALRDPLTGLYNRRYLQDRLSEEVARVARYGGVLTVAMVDLDDFKTVNDVHGHLYGDQALRRFGQAIQAGLRRSDIAFRYGGEEFVLLFPDTTWSVAESVLQRLGEQLPELRFSAGLAECPAEGAEAMTLLHRADMRLAEAKTTGKGRIVAQGSGIREASRA